MSNNPIDEIPPEMFLPLDQLETLTLSNNRLKHLPNFSKEIHRKFSSVNVSDNLLADFPFELENLSHLDLSSNQFDRFPSVLLRSLALKVLLFEDNRPRSKNLIESCIYLTKSYEIVQENRKG